MPLHTKDVSQMTHFRDRAVESLAKYGITNDDINVSIHEDRARCVNVLRVCVVHGIKKYGFEIVLEGVPPDIVERNFQSQIKRLEKEHLRSGECVVRYRNREFFYSFERDVSDDELSMTIQCEMCNRMLQESIPAPLSESRDVFLMWNLPDAHRLCVCDT
jgi:hypothetical protein